MPRSRSKSYATRKSRKTAQKKIGHVNQGTLRNFGYSANASRASRKRAVCAASKRYGKTPVVRKLNFLANMNKRRAPQLSNIFRRDMNVARTQCQNF